MPTAVWTGSLGFGLVSIPIRLYAAARNRHIQLHELHSTCHTRLKQPLFCPTHNRIVDRSEVVKGSEYEKGEYVLIDQAELDKITPRSGKFMEILAFVKESEIDPIYLNASYFAMPDQDGDKAYQLLLRALEDTGRLGIAKVTMHQREYTVFIRPRSQGLMIHTMYFQDEIQEVKGYGAKPKNLQLKPQEIKLARQLVETLAQGFKPEQYHDAYQERLRELIEAKRKGRTIAAEPVPQKGNIIDMMEALKKSLQQKRAAQGQQPHARPTASRRATRGDSRHRAAG